MSKVEIYKSLWGMTGPLQKNLERIKTAGYDGFECAPQEIANPEQIPRLAREYGLKLIALVYTEGDHFAEFDRITEFAANLGPEKILAHAGRDTMDRTERSRFFEHALRHGQTLGIPIAHETHRRRPLFSPMTMLEVLTEFPEIKLNVDYSHWCCVTESLLGDHTEALTQAALHAIHIHGRVGYEQGPQVPDPRWPQWAPQREAHEAWWRQTADSISTRGETVTFCPEYGPPHYQQTGKNGEPLSDLWEICLWTAERFRRSI